MPKLKLGTTRKWLHYAGGAMLIFIAVALLYRTLTGSTLRDQKLQKEAEKASLELSKKPAPNAEALSVKLERAREEAANAAKPATAPDVGGASKDGPLTPLPPVPSGSDKSANSPRLPASTPPPPSDQELDAYAQSKDANVRDANRRLASWEQKDDSTNSKGTGDSPSMRQAPSAAGVQSGTPASSALLDAYLKSQGGQGAAQSSQDQFRQSLPKGVAAPLYSQGKPGNPESHPLMEGDTIPVVMRVAVSSDIAGPCRAQVSEDIYDSLTQRYLLIPAGSRVICAYDSGVVQGQERLLIAFTRLIFPNGSSVALAGMPAADMEGAIGAPADVNSRFWRIYGSSLLIAAVTRAAEQTGGSASVTINTTGASGVATAAGVLAETARKTLERNLNIKPELRVKPGDVLRVVVTRDMVLEPFSRR
ncbi:hypothetical protein B9Z51_06835 [Limnohabitans sp. T6-5]|uniref:TrbI/VirB10 family protein n=1 Tax=Limnohabitans sp. T6-5 TaxID=1100724 RepID=UPI000D3481BC|nr:TrbI/VirB10 family protein [Limnohabitans sp. T6-5]PUE08660.1 hypothetical protein B9Z51_06835 [Limnohabitans sp. T6-5]